MNEATKYILYRNCGFKCITVTLRQGITIAQVVLWNVSIEIYLTLQLINTDNNLYKIQIHLMNIGSCILFLSVQTSTFHLCYDYVNISKSKKNPANHGITVEKGLSRCHSMFHCVRINTT
jgi:hypothetical protein